VPHRNATIGLGRSDRRENQGGGARRIVAPSIRHMQPDAAHFDAVVFSIGRSMRNERHA